MHLRLGETEHQHATGLLAVVDEQDHQGDHAQQQAHQVDHQVPDLLAAVVDHSLPVLGGQCVYQDRGAEQAHGDQHGGEDVEVAPGVV